MNGDRPLVGCRGLFLLSRLGNALYRHGCGRNALAFGALLVAEVTTVVRYAINDRWVFGELRLRWARLWRFHLANVGGFAIWWAATNFLARAGIHYVLASTAGTASSVLFSMLTNFLWIWRKRLKGAPTAEAAGN